MGQLEERLKMLIKRRYGGVPKLAEEIGLPASSIYTVLKSGISGGSVSTVLPILAALGIDSNWIIKNRLIEVGDTTEDFVDVPLYGPIAAGTPIEMIEVEDVHPVPSEVANRYPDAFLLRVDGESMNRIIPNGAYALVDPRDTVDHDMKPYAVCVNGFASTIKRVHKLNNGYELLPDSNDPTFTPEMFDFNKPDTESVTVIGEIVYYVLPFDWSF